jgi:osmotically-inducible protein OsmY
MKATLTAAALGIALAAPAVLQAADKTPVAREDHAATSSNHDKSSAREMVDDTLITTKVKSALIAEKGIDSGKISVETDKGKVMLSGDVKSPDQRQRAEGIARKVSGVKHVDNKLQVK